jgi:fructose-1,6-bisphosphatase
LDVKLTELHQRVPMFVGSKNMVDLAVAMLNEETAIGVLA